MLIQHSTLYAKVQVPKVIQWKNIKLPKEWLLEREAQPAKFVYDELNLGHIPKYLDRIEEKIEKRTSYKTEKPLIDLRSQRQNLSLKTTQTKNIEKVEQMLFDLPKNKN